MQINFPLPQNTKMYLSSLDERKCSTLVALCSALSCVYFFLIYTVLHLHNYDIKKCCFSVIFSCITAELMKYFIVQFLFVKKFSKVEKRSRSKKSCQKNVIEGIGRVCAVTLVSWILYVILFIIFGAPVFSEHSETCVFGMLVTVLTVFPVSLCSDLETVLELLFSSRLDSNLFNYFLKSNVQLTLCGAWLGAFVFPLDWDRPWQKWPIPCVIGALFGHAVSNLVFLIYTSWKTLLYPETKKNVKRA